MRIVCLINGGDGLAAYHMTIFNHPNDEVFPVHYELGLPFSQKLSESLPDYVHRIPMPHYATLIKRDYVDGSFNHNRTLLPLIWNAYMKYRADKIVMGMTTSDISPESNLDWVDEFNDQIETKVLSYPYVERGWTKRQIYQDAIQYGCLTQVLAAFTCRSKDPQLYGCGSCHQCLRKRSALIKMGRASNIPKPKNITIYIRSVIAEILHNDLSGLYEIEEIKRFEEISPSLYEAYDVDTPKALIRAIR